MPLKVQRGFAQSAGVSHASPVSDVLSDPLSDPLSGSLSAPIQRMADGGSVSSEALADASNLGSGGAVPYAAEIQQSFGAHDISGARAHMGAEATEKAGSIGAAAYASGNDVVFGSANPGKFEVAHELAHVVQQQKGVHLLGGLGEEGDVYEQQADAAAHAAVAGRSAESILGPVKTGGQAAGVQRKAIQRRVVKDSGDDRTRQGDGGAIVWRHPMDAALEAAWDSIDPAWSQNCAQLIQVINAKLATFNKAMVDTEIAGSGDRHATDLVGEGLARTGKTISRGAGDAIVAKGDAAAKALPANSTSPQMMAAKYKEGAVVDHNLGQEGMAGVSETFKNVDSIAHSDISHYVELQDDAGRKMFLGQLGFSEPEPNGYLHPVWQGWQFTMSNVANETKKGVGGGSFDKSKYMTKTGKIDPKDHAYGREMIGWSKGQSRISADAVEKAVATNRSTLDRQYAFYQARSQFIQKWGPSFVADGSISASALQQAVFTPPEVDPGRFQVATSKYDALPPEPPLGWTEDVLAYAREYVKEHGTKVHF